MSAGVIRVGVEAVELRGPGLANWAEGRPVLAGVAAHQVAPTVLEAPAHLSPAERRRAIPAVKLALAVADGAVEQSGHDPGSLSAVFASSGADGDTIGAVLSALATPGREVSPTRFHNSVHNAPSGYWSIAVQSREAVTSISCHDASFAAGMLEAGVQAASGGRPILLVAYDLPYPEPLASVRRIEASFGVAFVLSHAPTASALAALRIGIAATAPSCASRCADDRLEDLRRGNPAARSLPLLTMLATRSSGRVVLDLGHAALDIDVTPW